MKKLFLTLGLASLFMVACNNTPKQEEQPAEQPATETTEVVEEKHECPMHAIKEDLANLQAEYAKWDEMDDATKAALNQKTADVFAKMNAVKTEMMEKNEECAKKMAEMTDEQKAECEAKCAEMKAAWDNFANLGVEEQKEFLMKQFEGCGGEKKCCNHEGEEGHQCQHAAE